MRNPQYFYTADSDVQMNNRESPVAFPLQQWLRECATMLLYLNSAYLAYILQ